MFGTKTTDLGQMIRKLKSGDYLGQIQELSAKLLGDDVLRDPTIRYWLPSGIYPLDLAVSRGLGLPAGKVLEIFGGSKAGKTTLCLTIGKQAQLQGGQILWVDYEAAMSLKLAIQLVGVQTDPLLWDYFQPLEVESSFDYVEARIRLHSEVSEKPLVIVFDSIAALVAKAERDKSMQDSQKVSDRAGTLSRFLPRILTYLSRGNIYLLMINQIRTKGYASGGGKATEGPTGGKAPEFFSHLRFDLRTQEIVSDDDGSGPYGSLVRLTIDKSRIDTPFRSCLYPIYFRDDQFRQGIDEGMACLIYLISRKKLYSGGGWLKFAKEEKESYRKEQLRQLYYQDPAIRERIRNLTLEVFQEENKITTGSLASPPVPTPVPGFTPETVATQ